jgi:hypothetical protein
VELSYRSEEAVSVPDKVRDILVKKERKVSITYRAGSAEEGEIIEHNDSMIEVIACDKDESTEDMYWVYGYFHDFRGLEPQ